MVRVYYFFRINFVEPHGHALSHNAKCSPRRIAGTIFVSTPPLTKAELSTLWDRNKNATLSGGAFCLYRGPERIRTAVQAFAELCLATRPQDLLFLIPLEIRRSKLRKVWQSTRIFLDLVT